MKNKTVSVIIPCLNAENFIANAIKSVRNQTFPVTEIIVVDNCSTDKTREIAESFGVKLIIAEEGAIRPSRNAGMSASEGEWIAFLDADDYWFPNKIQLQMKAAEIFPESRVISCNYKKSSVEEKFNPLTISIDEKMVTLKESFERNGQIRYCAEMTAAEFDTYLMIPSTVLLNRKVLAETGFFDEKQMIEDVEYFARVLRNQAFSYINEVLVDYRIHDANYSSNFDGIEGIKRMTEKMLRFPDNYVGGIGERFRSYLKSQLAAKMKSEASKLK